MNITILFFGVATDLATCNSTQMEIPPNSNIADFKLLLLAKFSKLTKMSSYAVAVNESYATDETIINKSDVIAIIPPVSGG